MKFLEISNNPQSFYNDIPNYFRTSRSVSFIDIKKFIKSRYGRFRKLARKKFPIKPPKFMKWQEICLNSNINLGILYGFLLEQAYQISIIKGENKTIWDIYNIFQKKINLKKKKYPNTKNMKNYDKRFICNLLVKVYNEYMSLKQEDFDRVCQSSDTLIGDEWIVVPFGDIVMYKSDNDKKVYCFTVDELLSIENGVNPYNREPIPEDAIFSAKTRKEFFSRVIQNNDDDLEEKLLFGRLWDELDMVPTYPIDRDIFLAANYEQIMEIYNIILENSDYSQNLKKVLDRFEPHLDFVKQALNLIAAVTDRQDINVTKYLIDQAMKQILISEVNIE